MSVPTEATKCTSQTRNVNLGEQETTVLRSKDPSLPCCLISVFLLHISTVLHKIAVGGTL